MTSPVVIGVVAAPVAPIRKNRGNIRFQNTGASLIYIKKVPIEGSFSVVSPTDYEIFLAPSVLSAEAGDAFETDSISSFMAISSAIGGVLSIYETIKV